MLASARSSCARTLSLSRPAWSLALPAESSRQAAVRASLHAGQAAFVRPVHGGTKAPYSAAAVAVAEGDQEPEYGREERGFVRRHERPGHASRQHDDGYGEWIRDQDAAAAGRFSMPSDTSSRNPEPSSVGVEGSDKQRPTAPLNHSIADTSDEVLAPYLANESKSPPRPDRPAPPAAPSSIENLPPLMQFRNTLSSHPRFALRVFGDMATSDLHRLTILEYDTLLHSLSKSFGSESPSRTSIPDEELRPLVRLHAALREYRDTRYTEEGEAIHGKRLVRLMRACMFLGAHAVFRSIWKGRLDDLQRERAATRTLVDQAPRRGIHTAFPGANALNQIAEDLTKAREWKLSRWLFQPAQMQLDWYTPSAFEAAVRALQAHDEPQEIVRLAGEMEARNIRATADTYCALMQAYLELGEVDLARATLVKAERERELSSERVQIGLLRGHMAIGGSSEVADRVMQDIAALKIAPTARLLNALIRNRLQHRDTPAALKLFANFDFAGGETEATAETYALTLRLHAQSSDIANLRMVWHRLVSASISLDAQHLLVVITALSQAGPAEADEALKAIKAHIDQTPFSAWRIPSDLVLSPGVMNALLHGMARHHGLTGMERTLRLMRRAGVAADDSTAQILMDFVTVSSKSPLEGIHLLEQLRARLPVRATSDTLDKALGAALATCNRGIALADPSSAEPHAGIKTSAPFQRAISPVLQSLQARQARSTSTTLAHRLQYEALVQSAATQSGVPDVRHVWQQMLARGYEPTEEHILALVKGYAQTGAMKQAEETLKLADEQGIPRTPGMWMEMLVGWTEKGQLEKAERAYRQICDLGARAASGSGTLLAFAQGQPDMVAMTAMTRAYYVCGSYDKARMMALAMIDRFGKLDPTALVTAVHAIRLDNRQLTALHLVRKQTTELSTSLRRIIKNIRNHAFRTARKKADAAPAPAPAPIAATAAASPSYDLGSSYKFSATAADRAKIYHLADELLKRDDAARPISERRAMSAKTVRDRLMRAVTDDGKRKRGKRAKGVSREIAPEDDAASSADREKTP